MSLDLEQHIKAEIALSQKKIAELDAQILSKASKLMADKKAEELKMNILKSTLNSFIKSNKGK